MRRVHLIMLLERVLMKKTPDETNNVDDTGNGGTAHAQPAGPSKPIPTLSEWALILMSVLLGLAVFARQRKLL